MSELASELASETRAAILAPRVESATKILQVRELGRIGYAEAFALQQDFVDRRKRGEIPDQLLIVEHPHVVTMGRNGHDENLLAPPDALERQGIDFHRTNRGGDVTYHGPGQIVGYPILDLREWKRDVVAYVRTMEQALIDAMAEFSVGGFPVEAGRVAGATGVWVREKTSEGVIESKIAAIGVHISRWVTSHGFALNVDTDLSYYSYIVPCGLTKPVTTLRKLGVEASRAQVTDAIIRNFSRVFGREVADREN